MIRVTVTPIAISEEFRILRYKEYTCGRNIATSCCKEYRDEDKTLKKNLYL